MLKLCTCSNKLLALRERHRQAKHICRRTCASVLATPTRFISRSEWMTGLLATVNKRLANTMRHRCLIHSYFHAFFFLLLSVSFNCHRKYISLSFYIVPWSQQIIITVRLADKRHVTLHQSGGGGVRQMEELQTEVGVRRLWEILVGP